MNSLCFSVLGWKLSEANAKNLQSNKIKLESLHSNLQKLISDNMLDPDRVGIKKKNAIHMLFNSITTARFSRTVKRGVFIALILYSRDKSLYLVDDLVPIVEVCDTQTTITPADFNWLMKISYSWFNLKSLRFRDNLNNSNWDMRKKLIFTIKNIQQALGITNLGHLYHKDVRVSDEAVILPFIALEDPKNVTALTGKWQSMDKIKKGQPLSAVQVEEMIKYHETSTVSLQKGLYLGYLSIKTSLSTLYVMTSRINILPHCKIRDNPYVCGEEWEILKQNKVTNANKSYLTELQLRFLQDLQVAVTGLLKLLNGHTDLADLRFYTFEVVEINEGVSFIIVCPKAENFCNVINTKEEMSVYTDRVTYLPLKVFELIHLFLYQNDIARKHYELSCTLDLELAVATQASREAFSADEVEQAKIRLTKLSELSDACKDLWKSMNWIGDLIKFAQDKATPTEPTLRNVLESKRATDGTPKSKVSTPKMKDFQIFSSTPKSGHHHRSATNHSHHNHQHQADFERKMQDLQMNVESVKLGLPETSILQVYAAYDTGLPSGTSLKLRVTPKTTSREVIDLVVKQLNMAVVLKGKEGPIYGPEELQNFCLVAIIGARERCLRDDFRPLQLQNPWKKGTLYVRQKQDLLAAIEHSNHQTAI